MAKKKQQLKDSEKRLGKKARKDVVSLIAAMIHKERLSSGNGIVDEESFHGVSRWQTVGRKEALR